MDRRKFITYSTVGSMGLVFSLAFGCDMQGKDSMLVLSTPSTLSAIVDRKTIIDIGQGYLEVYPLENNENDLVNLLIGQPEMENSDNEVFERHILQKIKDDFNQGNTVIIHGWILSISEARQCALYSLSN